MQKELVLRGYRKQTSFIGLNNNSILANGLRLKRSCLLFGFDREKASRLEFVLGP